MKPSIVERLAEHAEARVKAARAELRESLKVHAEITALQHMLVLAPETDTQGRSIIEERLGKHSTALNCAIDIKEARELVKAGWKAAIDCHTHHGMSGWSSEQSLYLESALHSVVDPDREVKPASKASL